MYINVINYNYVYLGPALSARPVLTGLVLIKFEFLNAPVKARTNKTKSANHNLKNRKHSESINAANITSIRVQTIEREFKNALTVLTDARRSLFVVAFN